MLARTLLVTAATVTLRTVIAQGNESSLGCYSSCAHVNSLGFPSGNYTICDDTIGFDVYCDSGAARCQHLLRCVCLVLKKVQEN